MRGSYPCSLLTLPIIGTRSQMRCADLPPKQNCGAPFSPIWKNTTQAPAYLSRRIRTAFGKTFQILLQEQRISAAEKLLRATSLGVEEIIHAVGYENQSNFYRVFSKTYGMTPHKYRKTPTA